jgi:hypothetical protein
MIAKNYFTSAAAAVALMLGVGAADASLLTISGGTAFNTPADNNVLGAGLSLLDNAGLSTTAAGVTLSYYFWGSESGADNTLVTPFGSHTESDNATTSTVSLPFPGLGSPLFSGTQAAAGAVDLKFSSSIFANFLTLGGGDANKSIALAYLNNDGTISTTATNLVLFTLDDSGAGPDDNHDDYVGIVSAVPIPAAAWLFGSALLGLAGVGRRKLTGAEV